MSRGSIRRRGKASWELKFDVRSEDGGRRTKYVNVKGKRSDAERELIRLLSAIDTGTLVEPSKLTVAGHLRAWLDAADVQPKTLERYRALAEQQITPHLGAVLLQRLRPAAVKDWHETLRQRGGKDGKPLSARTVGHAHRLLHTALQAAVAAEKVSRNVASVIPPPKVEAAEVQILTADQIPIVLTKLTGHDLYAIANTALASGARRGELLALPWRCVDFDGATVCIERALEQTKGGLRFKAPKTKHGRRTITLPAGTVAVLREHRVRQLQARLQLGLGRPGAEALVFCRPTGEPIPPNDLSRDWVRACNALGLPSVMFHALRHTHASALIAAGVDIVKISRRLGHGSPSVTLSVYAHLFDSKDDGVAEAIDLAMGAAQEAR
jgi:integrase